MKNIYLAARYDRRQEILMKAKQLRRLGFTVTSRWIQGLHGTVEGFTGKKDSDFYSLCASEDLCDIDVSDTIVLFTEDPEQKFARGGRHVEYGYALAKQKRLIVIGPVENIFHLFPCVTRFECWGDFVKYLEYTPYENK